MIEKFFTKEKYDTLIKYLKNNIHIVSFGKNKVMLEETYNIEDKNTEKTKTIKKRDNYLVEKYFLYDTLSKSIVDISIVHISKELYKMYIYSNNSNRLSNILLVKKIIELL